MGPVKVLRLLLALTLCWLALASESRADMVNNRAWEKLKYPSVIQDENGPQPIEGQLENLIAYGECASGRKVWTSFDPDGLWTTQQYRDDEVQADKDYKRDKAALLANPNGLTASQQADKLYALSLARDNRVEEDDVGMYRMAYYAKWGEAHGLGHINYLLLDDDKGNTPDKRSPGGKLYDNIEEAWTLAACTGATGAAMTAELAGMGLSRVGAPRAVEETPPAAQSPTPKSFTPKSSGTNFAAGGAAQMTRLVEGDARLVIMKDGKIIAEESADAMLSHGRFASQVGALSADGTVKAGYWVGTIGKMKGEIFALSSQSLYGTTIRGAAEATAVAKQAFK